MGFTLRNDDDFARFHLQRTGRIVRQTSFRPSSFATEYARELAYIGKVIATSPRVAREPPLACYTTASCDSK